VLALLTDRTQNVHSSGVYKSLNSTYNDGLCVRIDDVQKHGSGGIQTSRSPWFPVPCFM